MERSPEIAKQQLAAVERMRQDFVANVSHELRTPLTVIRGYLEMLTSQSEINPDKWRPIFSQMFSQSLRMEQLISDLLLLSRLEMDAIDVKEHRQCNMPGLLHTICDEARTVSNNRHHRITLQCDPRLDLNCNHDEMRSAISNIVFNAIKYTPPEGHIDVSWGLNSDGSAFLRVADTGIGIKEKHIPRLTERFYRVDKARSRDNGGTGLGLAIVKHVLIRHNAVLEIESNLGEGSVFTCLFLESSTIVASERKESQRPTRAEASII